MDSEWLSVYRSFAFVVMWLPGGCGHCPASQGRVTLLIASPGKQPSAKFKVRFLLNGDLNLAIIKSKKSLSWKHAKSGTFYEYEKQLEGPKMGEW